MGRYGSLDVGGVPLAMWYETFGTKVASLFLDEDGIASPDDPGDFDPPRSFTPIHYVTTAAKMRERLTLLGVRASHKDAAVETAWAEMLVREPRDGGRGLAVGPTLADAIAEWLVELNEPPKDAWDRPKYELLLATSSVRIDDYSILRFFADRVPDDFQVALDLSSVWGLHDQLPTPTFCADARAEVQSNADQAAPTIVLTEGSSDAIVLGAAVELLRPHLAGFITFMDYSASPAGGVDGVVKGLRAFAAAGVGNRVIGLLDNDTAGKEGMRQIGLNPLPARMKAIQLPSLELAKDYPSIGTEGLVSKDINGSAVSIELFMGEDVLRDHNGLLTPVQMASWNEQHKQYQGAITSKADIKKKFFDKLAAARAGGFDRNAWADLDALLDHIIAAV